MKPILPLESFDPRSALPEHFIEVALNLSSVQAGMEIHFPAGTWSSIESAMNDPRTRITYNGVSITPWEVKMLRGFDGPVRYIGATK